MLNMLTRLSNTLAAGPPALALGLEPTALDAMDLAPSAFQSIFTLEFYADLIFYGFLMGALSIVNFVIVLWGYFPVSHIYTEP
jgi:Na+-exporting ATPase